MDAVAEDSQQRLGFVAVGNSNRPVGPCKTSEFMGLMDVTAQQDKKLRWSAAIAGTLVTLGEHIVGEQGHHFLWRDLLADACHAQERTQRSRNNDCGRRALRGRLICRGKRIWGEAGNAEQERNRKSALATKRFHGWSSPTF